MPPSLPNDGLTFMTWEWSQIEPHYQTLVEHPIGQEDITAWLADWSRLQDLIYERHQRHYVATTLDTTDNQAEQDYNFFLDEIYPQAQAADQRLKQKLLDNGIEPTDFEIPLRNMRTQAELFREANLPLLSEELKLANEYARVISLQTIQWEGQELTIDQVIPLLQANDRSKRAEVWRLARQRQLADREAINEIWVKLMDLRRRLAENAKLLDYRAYRWRQMLRFDYTPEDCAAFRQAIREVIMPAALRSYERRRERLGLETLRPWDLNVDPFNRPALQPFDDVAELEAKSAAIFHQIDPQLGAYFESMRQDEMLDLENRKGKAPGGYCTDYTAIRKAFIFMNAVGVHDDVQTLIHEGGHAFHVYESANLPYHSQLEVPMEFAEVASMSMEFLAGPYLTGEEGGFYSPAEAARARIEHLEFSLQFWPYMAVVDEFQHWAYENHDAASDPASCDQKWGELWDTYMIGVDWSGFEDQKLTGWHRKEHIFEVPFYYVEYGLAQLGAVQVWQNAQRDQATAVADYRRSLSLGGTVSLPKLFDVAGARFAFDSSTLGEAVALMENTIAELEHY
jgi:oligoendopeptidase F